MKKNVVLILIIVILCIGGVYWYITINGRTFYQKPAYLYPFTIKLMDKSRQEIQIYHGTWTQTGGNTIDYHHKLQTEINGKVTDIPMVTQKITDSSGVAIFMLPAGKYFVYISNPAYEDDVPRDISIPENTNFTINSSDKH